MTLQSLYFTFPNFTFPIDSPWDEKKPLAFHLVGLQIGTFSYNKICSELQPSYKPETNSLPPFCDPLSSREIVVTVATACDKLMDLAGKLEFIYIAAKSFFFWSEPGVTPNSGNDATHLAPKSHLVSGKEVVFF